MTGDGMEEFFLAVDEARKEYEAFVQPFSPSLLSSDLRSQ